MSLYAQICKHCSCGQCLKPLRGPDKIPWTVRTSGQGKDSKRFYVNPLLGRHEISPRCRCHNILGDGISGPIIGPKHLPEKTLSDQQKVRLDMKMKNLEIKERELELRRAEAMGKHQIAVVKEQRAVQVHTRVEGRKNREEELAEITKGLTDYYGLKNCPTHKITPTGGKLPGRSTKHFKSFCDSCEKKPDPAPYQDQFGTGHMIYPEKSECVRCNFENRTVYDFMAHATTNVGKHLPPFILAKLRASLNSQTNNQHQFKMIQRGVAN